MKVVEGRRERRRERLGSETLSVTCVTPINSISCFPFETFLGKLKKTVRRPHKPVEQIVKRVYETQSIQKKREDVCSLSS